MLDYVGAMIWHAGHVVPCWGVSKYVGVCLWALPLLCSVLQSGLVPSPPCLPCSLCRYPTAAVLGLERECRPLAGNLLSLTQISSLPSPCSVMVLIYVSCHCTQGHALLHLSEGLAG